MVFRWVLKVSLEGDQSPLFFSGCVGWRAVIGHLVTSDGLGGGIGDEHVSDVTWRKLQWSRRKGIKAWTIISKPLTDRYDFNFASDLRWLKLVLISELIWLSNVKPESKITLQFFCGDTEAWGHWLDLRSCLICRRLGPHFYSGIKRSGLGKWRFIGEQGFLLDLQVGQLLSNVWIICIPKGEQRFEPSCCAECGCFIMVMVMTVMIGSGPGHDSIRRHGYATLLEWYSHYCYSEPHSSCVCVCVPVLAYKRMYYIPLRIDLDSTHPFSFLLILETGESQYVF